jgi:hypothetical protein
MFGGILLILLGIALLIRGYNGSLAKLVTG